MAEIEECVKCHRSRTGVKVSFDKDGNAYVNNETGEFVCDECFRKYKEMKQAIEADSKLTDAQKNEKRRAAANQIISDLAAVD